ncbi:hypothetical protein [Corynebacterium sanguinis]|uniref:Uncharacterized protein n=1 Tax=Corynebacterium sanguinis TaxID=2594913 RepID=A0A6C1TWC3_9CORY|nr:hypothetical protein [Corynebacterium sanguinis]TVS26148.1 hypothetical protein EKI59_11175 [Corynebacterium sanguinis]
MDLFTQLTTTHPAARRILAADSAELTFNEVALRSLLETLIATMPDMSDPTFVDMLGTYIDRRLLLGDAAERMPLGRVGAADIIPGTNITIDLKG